MDANASCIQLSSSSSGLAGRGSGSGGFTLPPPRRAGDAETLHHPTRASQGSFGRSGAVTLPSTPPSGAVRPPSGAARLPSGAVTLPRVLTLLVTPVTVPPTTAPAALSVSTGSVPTTARLAGLAAPCNTSRRARFAANRVDASRLAVGAFFGITVNSPVRRRAA